MRGRREGGGFKEKNRTRVDRRKEEKAILKMFENSIKPYLKKKPS